ncbi:host-nuclease inhibitor Gam family protein [Candidatus Sumerlaeota bacterium]|nr:host-nuclease inhibitor Gam family protein [Candidatus Sumerlaeota bacterium]
MARKKVTPRASSIKSWDEADASMKRIAEIERAIHGKESSMNAKMDAMKQGYADEVKPLQEEKESKEKDLEAFCREHRSEFGNARSKQLIFGKLSFRDSVSLTIHNAGNPVAAIKKMLGEKASMYLTTKESPNKEALERLPDTELAPLGCKRSRKETFGYEINWESLS